MLFRLEMTRTLRFVSSAAAFFTVPESRLTSTLMTRPHDDDDDGGGGAWNGQEIGAAMTDM